jgi:hypothetical protein
MMTLVSKCHAWCCEIQIPYPYACCCNHSSIWDYYHLCFFFSFSLPFFIFAERFLSCFVYSLPPMAEGIVYCHWTLLVGYYCKMCRFLIVEESTVPLFILFLDVVNELCKILCFFNLVFKYFLWCSINWITIDFYFYFDFLWKDRIERRWIKMKKTPNMNDIL